MEEKNEALTLIEALMYSHQFSTFTEVAHFFGIASSSLNGLIARNSIKTINRYLSRKGVSLLELQKTKKELESIQKQEDDLDLAVEDLIAITGSRSQAAVIVQKIIVQKIIERLEDFGKNTVIDKLFSFLPYGDEFIKNRPFLFLYYIIQIINHKTYNDTINNYKQYILDQIKSFNTKNLIKNRPGFTKKAKLDFADYIDLKFSEDDCKVLVMLASTVIQVLEDKMPPAIIRAHRNVIQD